MKIQHLYPVLFTIAVIALFSGCMTPVTVQTDPPGATVYCRGWGRPSYKWRVRGRTEKDKPVTFRVPYNTIHTIAIWENGESGGAASEASHRILSEEVETDLFFTDPPTIILKPKAR